jgi:hypothetical protein
MIEAVMQQEMGQEMKKPDGGITIPFAVLGPLVALVLALSGWNFTLNSRLTALETQVAAPSKLDAQLAAITTELRDFKEMYERDRINDRVVSARDSK